MSRLQINSHSILISTESVNGKIDIMRYDTLPPEFQQIAHLVSQVVKRTATEWSGTCPQCGGGNHKSGEPSDRFRMWTVSKIGKPLGWCRRCSYTWFPDKGRQPTDEEKEAWRLEQIRIETERKEAAERALELLNNEKIWEQFYKQNNEWSYKLLEERGFSKSWIEYLQFGLNTDFTVWTRSNEEWEQYHSPALTIPIWSVGNVVNEVKLRVLNPKSTADRYRSWYKTRTTSLYLPMHDMAIENKAIIIEGEFKSAKVAQTIDTLDYTVVGVQSKKPDAQILKDLAHCEVVYLGLDPDAFEKDKNGESAVEYCTRELGRERVRIIEFPCKVDDGIIEHGLDPMRYIRMARKA